MSSVEERSAAAPTPLGSQLSSPRPRRTRTKRRRRLARTLILLFLVVAAFVVIAESLSLVRHARAAQASLEAFKASLQNNDTVGAQRHLQDADTQLAVARRRYHSAPLAVASHIPLLGWPVSDAGRLLSAATDVASAGRDALGLYEQVRGSGSKLFHNDTVSLPELNVVTHNADGMVAKMDRAEKQLKDVHAAFWEPSIGHARDTALRQVVSLRGQGRTAQQLLDLAPRLVGADGVRTYLVAVLNPAELQAAGGSALNMMAIRFNQGHMKILQSGATFDITDQNTPTHFTPLPDDPWLAGTTATVLAAADRSPDFRTSGQELMRGYTAQFGIKLDGVIALDPIALQGLMRQIPPVTTAGYGEITADNIVKTLLVDSYVRFPNLIERHAYNSELMTNLLHSILGGGHMLGKGKSLRDAAVSGHLQIYMNDGTVQQQVAKASLLRTLPDPNVSDVLGVYTANTNASKVDFWQRRSIDQRVKIAADGSASVVRTITITNASPPYQGNVIDPGSGYLTRFARPLVSMYVPAAAQVAPVTVNGRPTHALNKTERGLHAVFLRPITLVRGESLSIVLRYHLPPGTMRGGRYDLAVAAQPMVQRVYLRVSVSGPGICHATTSGWNSVDGAIRYTTNNELPFRSAVVCR